MLHEICASGAGTSGASPIHFYVFPPDADHQVRHGRDEAEVPAEDRDGRDRDGLRRHRAQRRHRHLAHPDARREAGRSLDRQRPQGLDHQRPARQQDPAARADERPRPAEAAQGHDALLRRSRPQGGHGAPDREARPRGRGLQRDLHREPGGARRRTWSARSATASTTCSTRSTPSASWSASRRSASGAPRSSAPSSTPRSASSSTGPSARTRRSRIRWRYAAAELDAAELMCLKAAWLFDHGRPCGREANAAKLLAAEAGFKACDAALQTFGGFGYAQGVLRRAALARDPALQDRARLPADGAELSLRARAGAAALVLIATAAPDEPDAHHPRHALRRSRRRRPSPACSAALDGRRTSWRRSRAPS